MFERKLFLIKIYIKKVSCKIFVELKITQSARAIFILYPFISFTFQGIILLWKNTGSASENYEVFEMSNHSSYSIM